MKFQTRMKHKKRKFSSLKIIIKFILLNFYGIS